MLLSLFNLLIKVLIISAQPNGDRVNFVLVKEEEFYEKHGDQCTDFEFTEIISQDEWQKRPNYNHALTAKSKSADYSVKNRSEFCQTQKTCQECTLYSTFQCVWCYEFGCAFINNKKCENHEVKFCPVIKHKGIVLIPAGLYSEISLNLLISNPGLIAEKHLACKIVMPHKEISLRASYSNGIITCERHVFDNKVECGYIIVYWGGFQPYSNKLDVYKYRCNTMAKDPTSCNTISERYECQWCLSSGLCTLRNECNNIPNGAMQLKTTTSKEESEFSGVTIQSDQYTDLDNIEPNYKKQTKLNSKPTSLSPPLRTTHTTRIPEIRQFPERLINKEFAEKLNYYYRLEPLEPEEVTDEEIMSPTERTLLDEFPFLKSKDLKVTNQDTATQFKNNQLRNIQLRNISLCINDTINTILSHRNKDARLIKLLKEVKRLLSVEQNLDLNASPKVSFNFKKKIMGKMKEIDAILLETKLKEKRTEDGTIQLKTITSKEENEFSGDTTQSDQYTDFDNDTNNADIEPNYKNQTKFNRKPIFMKPPLRTTHTTRIPEIKLRQFTEHIIYNDLAKKLHYLRLETTPFEPEEETDDEIISPIKDTLTDSLPFLNGRI